MDLPLLPHMLTGAENGAFAGEVPDLALNYQIEELILYDDLN